jgi:hypothetical protein
MRSTKNHLLRFHNHFNMIITAVNPPIQSAGYAFGPSESVFPHPLYNDGIPGCRGR